jgi:hypothetical protein
VKSKTHEDKLYRPESSAGMVKQEEEYLYSSCRDFYGTGKDLLSLEMLLYADYKSA